MAKTHQEKVLAKVGKRPQTAKQIAEKLGYESHQAVAKALGQGVSQGVIVKKDGRYQKAL